MIISADHLVTIATSPYTKTYRTQSKKEGKKELGGTIESFLPPRQEHEHPCSISHVIKIHTMNCDALAAFIRFKKFPPCILFCCGDPGWDGWTRSWTVR